MTPEVELANLVLSWDLRTDKGLRAHDLARQILGQKDPKEALLKTYLINEILELEKDMPRLEDLKKSLLAMSPEELRQKIHTIREDRILRKGPAPKTPVQKAERKSKLSTDLGKLLSGMSDAEREAFIKELEGNG